MQRRRGKRKQRSQKSHDGRASVVCTSSPLKGSEVTPSIIAHSLQTLLVLQRTSRVKGATTEPSQGLAAAPRGREQPPGPLAHLFLGRGHLQRAP